MATIERRKSANGKITFRVRVRRDGFKPLSKTFDLRGEAVAWGRAVEARMDSGEFRALGEARTTTVREALERYEREVTPRKKGAKQESARIKWWMASDIADLSLVAVRGMDVAAIRDADIAKGRKGSTIRNKLMVLSHLYTIARKEWGMEGLPNPCDDVARPPVGAGRRRRLNGAEEQTLLETAGTLFNAAVAAFFSLAIDTAMRRGELCAARWDDVDLDACVIALPKTKNGDAREVPLWPRAVKTLRVLKDGPRRIDGLIFGYEADTLSHYFRATCAAAGIRGLRLHDLRHEGTSRFVECGLYNMVEVAAITGHKTMVMLKHYSHPRAGELAKRMRKRGS